MTIDPAKVSLQVRSALENRLAQVLSIDRAELPVLSIAEIVSLLFCLQGHWNTLGGFGETASAMRALIGEELFWRRPKVAPKESERPEVVQ